MSLSKKNKKRIEQAINNGEFSIGYAIEKTIILPLYVYIYNLKTHTYNFLEINKEYISNNFNNKDKVTLSEIIDYLNNKDYSVLIESNKRSVVIDEIKSRYEKAIKTQQEIQDIKKIFEKNPEFII